MKRIATVLVEDEPKSARVLQNLLRDYVPAVEILAAAGTVAAALEILDRFDPELIFLDIEMPDGSGFDILKQFPVNGPKIIVTTAFDHYSLPAIQHSVLSYLLKPIDSSELVKAVEKFESVSISHILQAGLDKLIEQPVQACIPGKIVLPSLDGLIFLETAAIMYCKSEGSYTRFYLNNHTHILVSRNIGEYEESLPARSFCRIHNEYLVNLFYISRYIRGRGGYLILTDGTSIEVSARKRDQFLKRFQ